MYTRLEPLVIRDYSRIAPLRVWPCNCPTRVPYSDMPLELIDPQEVTLPKDPTTSSPKEEASPAETPVRGNMKYWLCSVNYQTICMFDQISATEEFVPSCHFVY